MIKILPNTIGNTSPLTFAVARSASSGPNTVANKAALTEIVTNWLTQQTGGNLSETQSFRLLAYTQGANQDGIPGFATFEQSLRGRYTEQEKGEFSTALRDAIFTLSSPGCKEAYTRILEGVTHNHNHA